LWPFGNIEKNNSAAIPVFFAVEAQNVRVARDDIF
jgi:hypothetical protein